METLVQDLRYACRTLLRMRGLSVVAILTLAIGIGATTTMFSVVYAMLLRPLPFPEPDRLVMLFNTSVFENIRYGRLDATAEDIRAAAVAADAAEFIEELPDGFETVVGVRGSILSGGQRQRLALARALVRAAPIVILDEPTSALDPATEARVLAGVRTSLARSAVLLVAHRWSTVQHADRVVVLERGRVVQHGDPRELMTLPGPYREFALAQGAALTPQP